VTNVQSGDGTKEEEDPDPEAADERATEPVPEGDLLVTLAVDASAVQRIVFTAEFGKLWLSAQPDDLSTDQLIIEDRGTVYR
jgi:pilus assembly protein CpaB